MKPIQYQLEDQPGPSTRHVLMERTASSQSSRPPPSPAALDFSHINQARAEAGFNPADFWLSAGLKTDIWASPTPPTLHCYTAPISQMRFDRLRFGVARATMSLSPALQYDQAGLIFVVPAARNPDPGADNTRAAPSHPAWIKAGLEVDEGQVWLSVVSRARGGWADQSLAPLPPAAAAAVGAERSATIAMVRQKNALSVYSISGGAKTLLRKVPWAFVDDPEAGSTALIGAYAARPDPDAVAGDGLLEVRIRNMTLLLAEAAR